MSDSHEQIPGGGRWHVWPVSITAFFAIAISGCAVFVIFCNRHPADLVAADYYEQEMRYQGQIDRVQRTAARSMTATVAYEQSSGLILIALPQGDAAASVKGSIQLYRPSALNLDREFKLEPDGNGRQKLDTAGLAPGLWRVRVSWTSQNQDFYTEQKIVIGPRAAT